MSWIEVVSFALALGLGSSAHCIGMCGVFAIQAASGPGPGAFLAYVLGKMFTYGFLGALAGALGAKIIGDSISVRAWAALLAAITLILAGIFAFLPGRPLAKWTGRLTQWMAPVFAAVQTTSGIRGRFVLGAVTGFLPCGVVYVAAIQSVVSGTILKSVALMFIFGLSTFPSLAFVGFLSGKMRNLLSPRTIRFAGAGLLILIGCLTGWRALVPLLSDTGVQSCCH